MKFPYILLCAIFTNSIDLFCLCVIKFIIEIYALETYEFAIKISSYYGTLLNP